MLTYIKKYIAFFIVLILGASGIANSQESQLDINVLKELQSSLTTGPIHQAIKGMTDSAGINVYPMFHIADDSALWPYVAELYFDVRAERKEPYLLVTLNFIPESGKWTDFASYKVQVHITQGNTKAIAQEIILPVEKQLNDLLANMGNLKKYIGQIRDNVADAIRKLRMNSMDNYWVGKNLPQVSFYAARDALYGFDPPVQEAIIRKYPDFYRYDTVVLAPWKSLSVTHPDKVNAYITIRDTAFKKTHIRFVNSMGVVLTPIQTKQDTLTFSLTGIADGKEDELTAEYFEMDPTGKERKAPLGQVKTITYSESVNTIHLVLVNGAKYRGTIEDLKKYLKNAYQQAVVSWDVVLEAKSLNVKDWDIDDDGKLKIETSILQRYSDEENTFITAWENENPASDPKAAYLFIVDMPNSLDARGYMPLNAHYGFIFVGDDNSSVHDVIYQNTIAHELGHGIFKLYHPWDTYGTKERQTDNLMDYVMGATLWKPQWDWIHDPGIRTYMFQNEGDGAAINQKRVFSVPKTIETLMQFGSKHNCIIEGDPRKTRYNLLMAFLKEFYIYENPNTKMYEFDNARWKLETINNPKLNSAQKYDDRLTEKYTAEYALEIWDLLLFGGQLAQKRQLTAQMIIENIRKEKEIELTQLCIAYQAYKLDKTIRIISDVTIIGFGVTAIYFSGGTATAATANFLRTAASTIGLLSGSISAVGGMLKLSFDISNMPQYSEMVPTGLLDATVGVVLQLTSKNDKSTQVVRAIMNAVEDFVLLKGDFFTETLINSGDFTISFIEVIGELKCE